MADDPRVGQILDDRYRIIEPLAQGGIGAVYRGERIKLGREVAIKFLHAWAAAEPTFVKRFELEAQAMARLQHPNCASVIDNGMHGSEPYVVMELIGGEALIDLLDRGPVPPPRAIEIVRQILAGLDHAHGQGVIHRDIKPSNIAVTTSLEFGDQVKVLDFGLAKLMESAGGLTGHFAVGTPTYMPPEQGRGDPVDARTDLYATGIVLFELLTGDPPFRGDDPAETLLAHQGTPPPLLSERRPDVAFSPALEAVVMRALRKEPADRFASAAEMARALEACPEAAMRRPMSAPPAVGSGPIAAPPPPRPVSNEPRNETMMLGSDAMIPLAEPLPPPRAASAPPAARNQTEGLASDALIPVVAPPPPPSASTTLPSSDSSAQLRPPAPSPSASSGTSTMIARMRPFLRTRQGIAAAVIGACALIGVIALIASGGSDKKSAPAKVPPRDPTEHEMPAVETSTELARLRARVNGGSTPDDVVRALHRLAAQQPTDPEIPLTLGDIYFRKLWVADGLEQFRKALALAPEMKEDERLLRATMYGLGADNRHHDVRRFLVNEIGPAAAPYLREVVDGNWRKEVKDRASAVLRDLGS